MAVVAASRIAKFVVDELEKGVTTSLVARKLASYLLENRQTREMPKVLRAIESECNKRGTTQVSVASVHAVTDEIKRELASLLDAKNPVFSETIDPSLIGGVKARSGEKEIDLTVRNKLNQFKTIVTRSA